MTILRSIAAPSLALQHPCCPIYPRHPYRPKRAKGAGLGGQRLCSSSPSDPLRFLAIPIDFGVSVCPMDPKGVGGGGVLREFSRPSRLR
jgi:hypothetical protein